MALDARTGCVQITALPACVNLALYRGDSFTLRLDVASAEGEPLDLAGAEVTAQIRLAPEAADVAGAFLASVEGSSVLLHLTAAASAALPPKGVWDARVDQAGQVTTLAAGALVLTPEVTRP
jgi:hypothetical protein